MSTHGQPAHPARSPVFTHAEIDFVRSTLRGYGVRRGLDDAVGAVLLAVTENLHKYDPEASLSAFLWAFARHRALKHHDLKHHEKTRLRGKREICRPNAGRLVLDPAPNPETITLAREELEILHSQLSALRPVDAESLRLRLWGMTNPDIATAVNAPVGTVSTHLRVARAGLRAARRRLNAREARHV